MKKAFERVIRCSLMAAVLVLIILVPTMETEAAAVPTSTSFYEGKNTKYKISGYSSDWEILSIKSSNKKVVTTKIYKKPSSTGKNYAVCTAKKPGNAIITYKYKMNGYTYTYKFKWKIVKYKNPLLSFTIGDTEYASKFNKKSYVTFENDGGEKMVSIKAKNGYTVDSFYVYYRVKNWAREKKYVNGMASSKKRFDNNSVVDMTNVDAISITMKDKKGNGYPTLYICTK